MPYLKLANASPADVSTADLATKLTTLTVDLLGKKRELTVVAVEPLPVDSWFVGGTVLGAEASGAVLEIRITEGTNTKAQKAAFIRAAFDALSAALPGLHPASYVTVHEPSADAWGYAGETQEYRHIRAQLL